MLINNATPHIFCWVNIFKNILIKKYSKIIQVVIIHLPTMAFLAMASSNQQMLK